MAVLGLDKAALDGRLGENATTFKKKSGRSAPLCSSDVQGPPHKPSGQSRKAWTSVTVRMRILDTQESLLECVLDPRPLPFSQAFSSASPYAPFASQVV